MIWYTLGIIICAVAGFFLANYIANNRYDGEHLVCPLGHSCDAVINGRFSTFFGIHVDKLGRFYYAIVAIFYIVSLFANFSQQLMGYALVATAISFAFSMYLTLTQLVVLKKWCSLCLGSASLSFLIMILAFLSFESAFADFIYSYRDLLEWIYLLSVLVGVVVTTWYMFTFIKFLRDFKISRREERRLLMFSHTAWVAIIFTLLSGLTLALTDTYNDIVGGASFIVMAVIVVILVVYEVVANMIITPRLIDVHFGDHPEFDDHEHSYQRKIAISFAAVGVVSWYMLLLLSTVSFYPYSSAALLIAYAIIVIVAVLIAGLVENILYRKSLRRREQEQQEQNIS